MPAMRLALAVLWLGTGCAGLSAATRAHQEADVAPAVAALAAARFDEASAQAEQALTRDQTNARAHAVTALAHFVTTNHKLVGDVMTLGSAMMLSGALRGNFVDTELFEPAFEKAAQRLADIDAHLGQATSDEGVSLELCLACWEVDWNRNGEVDDRDRRLLEVERDAEGEFLPDDDPRRRPTFRFDVTDVHWLRALVGFERAALELVRTWDVAPLAQLAMRRGSLHTVTLPLKSAERARHAHQLLLGALEESAACRASALREVDDDREWVPNPKQQQHAVPLPVDDALYVTWGQLVDDVRGLLESRESLEVGQLLASVDKPRADLPHGSVDLGRFLSLPHAVTLDLERTRRTDGEAFEAFLRGAFGDAWGAQQPHSPLPSHLKRMRDEVDGGRETFEHKLRYLFWLN
jgi:hypothetical protein